jgi:hypothetical protein
MLESPSIHTHGAIGHGGHANPTPGYAPVMLDEVRGNTTPLRHAFETTRLYHRIAQPEVGNVFSGIDPWHLIKPYEAYKIQIYK